MINKQIRYKKFTYWLCLLLIVGISAACSNNQEHRDYIQEQFISTYTHVTENNSTLKNLSASFNKMTDTNPDTFFSIAYRWHNFAVKQCDLEQTSRTSSTNKSSYEKMLSEETNDMQLTKIDSADRQCLAKIFLQHWQDINNMLTLHYTNLNN